MTKTLKFDLEKTFPDFKLDARAAFKPGITALFGPSGAGKTTLLNLLAGIDEPDEGAIAFGDGHFYNSVMNVALAPEKRGVGFVFQDDALFPHYSVAENLAFGQKRGKNQVSFEKLVKLFGLGRLLNRKPATLSGGEKKRVAIARALISGPEILFLDEPLANIDARRREAFFPYLEALRQEFDMPVVYVTHQLEEVLRLADYMAFLDNGKIIEHGPLADVYGAQAFQQYLPKDQRGVLIEGRVKEITGGLARVEFRGGVLFSADKKLARGKRARIRLLANDVAISLKKPKGISILNVLECKIADMDKSLSGLIELDLLVGGAKGEKTLIRADITPKSAADLELKKGMKVYALIKALAIISPGI